MDTLPQTFSGLLRLARSRPELFDSPLRRAVRIWSDTGHKAPIVRFWPISRHNDPARAHAPLAASTPFIGTAVPVDPSTPARSAYANALHASIAPTVTPPSTGRAEASNLMQGLLGQSDVPLASLAVSPVGESPICLLPLLHKRVTLQAWRRGADRATMLEGALQEIGFYDCIDCDDDRFRAVVAHMGLPPKPESFTRIAGTQDFAMAASYALGLDQITTRRHPWTQPYVVSLGDPYTQHYVFSGGSIADCPIEYRQYTKTTPEGVSGLQS